MIISIHTNLHNACALWSRCNLCKNLLLQCQESLQYSLSAMSRIYVRYLLENQYNGPRSKMLHTWSISSCCLKYFVKFHNSVDLYSVCCLNGSSVSCWRYAAIYPELQIYVEWRRKHRCAHILCEAVLVNSLGSLL